MKKSILITALFLLGIAHYAQAQIITTVAGSPTEGINDGGPAIDAGLASPIGVAIDGAGNVYIGDRGDNRIRKVNTSGIITTIAGTGIPGYSGDGYAATAAMINEPYGVAVDNLGNVYFADAGNICIRKINTAGIISTIAGNDTPGYNGDNIPATAAELNGVAGVAVDDSDNIYITDGGNNRIRKVNSAGIISTIAGNGVVNDSGDNGLAIAAELKGPYSILLDGSGNLYIGEELGARVRRINNAGIITTIAGTGVHGFSGDNGPATSAEMDGAYGLALDIDGNLYISDYPNYRIRKVSNSGIFTTYAGTGSPDYNGDNIDSKTANITPAGLALDNIGNLYIADFNNYRVRRIVSTVGVKNLNVHNGAILYPNPNHGDFTINIPTDNDEQAIITITNTTGEKVMEISTTTNKPLNVALDERVGLYFISVTTSRQTWCEKLLVI